MPTYLNVTNKHLTLSILKFLLLFICSAPLPVPTSPLRCKKKLNVCHTHYKLSYNWTVMEALILISSLWPRFLDIKLHFPPTPRTFRRIMTWHVITVMIDSLKIVFKWFSMKKRVLLDLDHERFLKIWSTVFSLYNFLCEH